MSDTLTALNIHKSFGETEVLKGISLHCQKMCQRGSDGPRIFGFRVVKRSETHRLTLIDQQVTSTIRFVFIPFNVVPIASGKQFPVKRPRIVATSVGAVLTELDRKAMKWASVQPIVKAFDDSLGSQLQILDSHQRQRIDRRCRRRSS